MIFTHGGKIQNIKSPFKKELAKHSTSRKFLSKQFLSSDCLFYCEAAVEATKFFLQETGAHGCHYLVDKSNVNEKFSASR